MILTLLCLLFGLGFYGCYIQPNIPFNNTNNTQQVEKKTRDNYYTGPYGDYAVLTFGDFMSYEYLFNSIHNTPIELYNTATIGESVEQSLWSTTSRANWYSAIDFEDSDYGYGDISYNVYNPTFELIYKSYGSNTGTYLMQYRFSFTTNLYDDSTGNYCRFDFRVTTLSKHPSLTTLDEFIFDLDDFHRPSVRGWNVIVQKDTFNTYFNPTYYDYSMGYSDGYLQGIESGPNNQMLEQEYERGRQVGIQEGLAQADYSSTANSIFNGIFTIGLLPVNVFLGFMDWEVFGINIAGLVSGLISVAIVVIIIRFILGHKV